MPVERFLIQRAITQAKEQDLMVCSVMQQSNPLVFGSQVKLALRFQQVVSTGFFSLVILLIASESLRGGKETAPWPVLVFVLLPIILFAMWKTNHWVGLCIDGSNHTLKKQLHFFHLSWRVSQESIPNDPVLVVNNVGRPMVSGGRRYNAKMTRIYISSISSPTQQHMIIECPADFTDEGKIRAAYTACARELQCDVHDERKGMVLPFSTFVDG